MLRCQPRRGLSHYQLVFLTPHKNTSRRAVTPHSCTGRFLSSLDTQTPSLSRRQKVQLMSYRGFNSSSVPEHRHMAKMQAMPQESQGQTQGGSGVEVKVTSTREGMPTDTWPVVEKTLSQVESTQREDEMERMQDRRVSNDFIAVKSKVETESKVMVDLAPQQLGSASDTQDRVMIDINEGEKEDKIKRSRSEFEVDDAQLANAAVDMSSPDILMRTALLVRATRVFSIAGRMFMDYRVTRWRAERRRLQLGLDKEAKEGEDEPEEVQALWDAAHERNARLAFRAISSLEGLWVKVGQYLSSRPDIMPAAYLRELSQLQDTVPSHPWWESERTLREELGDDWEALFSHFDKEPLSTASIGQVYEATLAKNGERVAVKLQHRGVSGLMRQDLQNLSLLVRLVKHFEPKQDFTPVVKEWSNEAGKELDFRIEASNLIEVWENLQKANIRAIVPQPISGMVTPKVLVMQFCEGISVRDVDKLESHGVDRNLLLDRICEAYADQMHRHGFFNADPHPGNLHVSTDPKMNGGDASVPILLDFGLTKRFEPHMKVAFSRMVYSSEAMDIDGLLQSFTDMGFKFKTDPFEDMNNMQRVFKAVPKSKVASERAEAQRQKAAKERRAPEAKRPVEAWPSELIFFFRVTALLKGLASSFDVDYPYLRTMSLAAKDTLIDTAMPDAKAALGSAQLAPGSSTVILGGNSESALQERLVKIVERMVESKEIIGMQVCVYKDGVEQVNLAAGTLGPIDPRPVKPDTLFNVFSATKAVAAATVHLLSQDGQLTYDDPVVEHWPQFASNGKEACTVRHVLQSEDLAEMVQRRLVEPLGLQSEMYIGIPSDVPSSRLASLCTSSILQDAASSTSSTTPSTSSTTPSTSSPTSSSSAASAASSANRDKSESSPAATANSLQRPSNTPLLTDDSEDSAGETPQTKQEDEADWERNKGSQQIMNPSVFNMRSVRESCLPAANGHMSARALAKFYTTLTTSDGSKSMIGGIFNPETVDAMRLSAPRASAPKAADLKGSDLMNQANGMKFGLGFQTHEFETNDGRKLIGLAHTGVGGSLGFAVPEEGLAVAVTVNQMRLKNRQVAEVVREIYKEFGVESKVLCSE